MAYRVGIIIMSDRAASGEREDLVLPVFRELLPSDFIIGEERIISDDPSEIKRTLGLMIDREINLIFTSGGTGCSARDNTPEVTRELIDKPTPGLDEAIRVFSTSKSKHAIFSRAVSGIANRSFIVNLPGSPLAVREILEFILPLIRHPLKLIGGEIKDCQAEDSGRD